MDISLADFVYIVVEYYVNRVSFYATATVIFVFYKQYGEW